MPKCCGLGSDVCPISHHKPVTPVYCKYRIVEQKPSGIPKRRRATMKPSGGMGVSGGGDEKKQKKIPNHEV